MPQTKLPVSARFLAVGALAAATAFTLIAEAKLAKSGDASASFRASGPAGLNIDGTTSDLQVGDDGAAVTITVPLANLTTGISLRDKHMREHLGVDQNPNAKLVVSRSALSFPKAGASTSGDAKGKMTLHGQTRDVTFHYDARADGDIIRVTSSTKIDMTDYGIVPPSYLGIRVKPGVDVKVSFSAKDS